MTDRIPLDHLTSDQYDQMCDERDAARATNRRLNLRAQQLESELAAYRRAVDQWEISERGTYVPLRTLAAIAKAAGLSVPERWELHHERAERAEAALARIAAIADQHPAGIDTALIHEALDEPAPATPAGPRHDDRPTVTEAREADRRWWNGEKAGER